MGRKKFFGLSKLVFGLAFLFIPFGAGAAGLTSVQYETRYDGKYYLTTQTLTKAKSPYLIQGGCAVGSVPSYATLTIEAGTVVKFDIPKYCFGGTIWAGITIYGNLIVNGTANEPVIFTSYYDDAGGGDSDGDGGAILPKPGDWNGISLFPGASNNLFIENAVFRYGGHGLSELSAGKVYNQTNITLRNLDISKSGTYGLSAAVPITITNSRFYENTAGAMYGDSFWNPQITAINNWWGSDSGPTVASNPAGAGEKIFGIISYDPWTGKKTNTAPVLSFPESDTDGVEPNLQYLPEQPTFKVMYYDADENAPLYMNVVIGSSTYPMIAGEASPSGTEYIFKPPTGTLQKGRHIFRFETSDGTWTTVLDSKLGFKLLSEVRNRPVILVPGIMGSEQKNGVWVLDPILHTYDNLMDTFRANGFKDGEDLFAFPYQWRQSNVLTAFQLKQKIDEVKNISGSDKVNIVAHSMGGLVAREYAQSDKYENDIDQIIFMGTPHLGAPKAYLMWEAGEFPNTLADKAVWMTLWIEAKKVGNNLFEYIKNGNAAALEQLLPVYDYLIDQQTSVPISYPNNYPTNSFLENIRKNAANLVGSAIKIFNIIGEQTINTTINDLSIVDSVVLPLWKNGMPVDFYKSAVGIKIGPGDGTVPIESSGSIIDDSIIVDSEHRVLPSNSSNIVMNKLLGILNAQIINNSKFINFKNLLMIKILSPADIVVIAPDGKRIGKNFSTGQEVDEIDGAFYSGFEADDEYVTIPNPINGEYRVETQGTGTGGEYTVVAGYIEDATTSEREFTGHILPEQITGIGFTVDSEQKSIVSMTPTDQVPPTIEILSPTLTDYTRSVFLPINVTSTDAGSGVFSQEISLDGTIMQNGTIVDAFFQKLGTHQISVTSTDFQNNIGVSSTSFRIIATISSTISDIERAYSLGWIKNKKTVREITKDIKEYFEDKKHEKEKGRKHERDDEDDENKYRKENKILNELNKLYRHKYINKQAFEIIKEDILWILSRNYENY